MSRFTHLTLGTLSALAVSFSLAAAPARADSISASVSGSVQLSTAITASVALTPIIAAYVGGSMVVETVRIVGTVAEVTLRGASAATVAIVQVGADVVRVTGLAAGQTVQVVAQGAGYAVMSAGTMIAFAPAAASVSLLHSSRSM
jgi:hypothetical protein